MLQVEPLQWPVDIFSAPESAASALHQVHFENSFWNLAQKIITSIMSLKINQKNRLI